MDEVLFAQFQVCDMCQKMCFYALGLGGEKYGVYAVSWSPPTSSILVYNTYYPIL